MLEFKQELQNRDQTSHIIIHHSAVLTPHSVTDVHKWHLKRGWAGIGYHYFINKRGEVFQGRPVGTIGAHALGYNNNSVGVCFEGDFVHETMQKEQLSDEAIELLFWLRFCYKADLLFCDELVGKENEPVNGFLKSEIKKRLEDAFLWYYNEHQRVSGSEAAGAFYDWMDERCSHFGLPLPE